MGISGEDAPGSSGMQRYTEILQFAVYENVSGGCEKLVQVPQEGWYLSRVPMGTNVMKYHEKCYVFLSVGSENK